MWLTDFLYRIMTIHFEPLIRKKKVFTYNDDTMKQPQSEGENFSISHDYHDFSRTAGLKASLKKTFVFSEKLKILGRAISAEGLQPIAKNPVT